jgi:class 3 adenylate cyclase
VRLFIVGAAQSCISSLPKSFRPKLADMIDEALAMPGGDEREKQEFLDDLDRNCAAERNAALLREGRDGMTTFLGSGRVDIQWLNSTIEAWIKPDPEPGTPAQEEEAPPTPQPVAIMFTDIILPAPVGGETSEEVKAKLVEQHDFTVGMAVKMHFGQQVQHMGTGMMAVFPRICDAIAASAVIQREVTDRNELGFGPSLPIRIGLGAGTSDPNDTNQFTIVVETAAKLCAAAAIGQVFMPAWLTDMQGCDRFTYSEQFAPPPKILPDQQRARMLLSTPEAPVSKPESEAGQVQEWPMAEKSAAPAPAAE